MTKSASTSEPCWSIPIRLKDVPEDGLNVAAAADSATCACIAKLAGVDAVLRLEASFDVVRRGSAGIAVMGEITARVRQTCVLTLETIESEISEPVGVAFAAADSDVAVSTPEVVIPVEDDQAPEPLIGGTADLGRLATEFLLLAVDRYPRKPGAEFQPPTDTDGLGSPFDALAALKKDRNPTS